MGTYRSVAWCKLEFHIMRCLLRTLPFTRKFVLQKYLKKYLSWLCTAYTMLVVMMIGWVFFSQTDFGAYGHYLGTMFGIGDFRFHQANCTLLPQDRIYPSSRSVFLHVRAPYTSTSLASGQTQTCCFSDHKSYFICIIDCLYGL